ncbi:MAG TPA: site-2 protease family protein [Solirubrobacterales bacterium]|nr:site-2 protease family protein [Solirubrobacterales bacterium]
MGGTTIRVGRLAGIPIGIHPLWVLIVALITWSLGAVYYPDQVDGIAPGVSYALGFASALLLFASILLHELGHAIVARRHGVEIEEIDLWLLGGVAKLSGMPRHATDELRYAIAGPAVTVGVIALFAIAAAITTNAPEELRAVVEYQLAVNVLILLFNLLPAFPLDGGRVLRALLWQRSGDIGRATATAATIGRSFGYGLIGLGLLAVVAGLPTGLWFALIGFFLILAARAEETHQRVKSALGGAEARELMAFPAVTISADATAEDAARRFADHRYRAFPVVDGDRVRGVLTIDRMEAIPAPQRTTMRVRDMIDDDRQLFIDEHTDVAELLDRPAFQRVGRAVVLPRPGGVGILSLTEVERAVRARERLSDGPTRSATAAGV